MAYRIKVARPEFKFSCAHMTVFPDGRKERLHGHNFYLAVVLDISSVRFEHMIEFEPIKSAVRDLCAEWKERTLIARDNPHLVIARDDGAEIELTLCGQRYVLPREDVRLLPVDNVSVEALAAHAADLLLERLGPVLSRGAVKGLEVSVEESPGQGASCYRNVARPTCDTKVSPP